MKTVYTTFDSKVYKHMALPGWKEYPPSGNKNGGIDPTNANNQTIKM
jgi:hypothetical protein